MTYPLALDNAFLDVSQPAALLVSVKMDSGFNVTDGLLLLVFRYRLVELFLPDPYTGAATPLAPSPVVVAAPTAGIGSAGAGALAAEVTWTTAAKVDLRLADMAHQHPAQAPTTEASSVAVQPSKLLPTPVLDPFPLPVFAPAAATTIATTGNVTHAAAKPKPAPLPCRRSAAL